MIALPDLGGLCCSHNHLFFSGETYQTCALRLSCKLSHLHLYLFVAIYSFLVSSFICRMCVYYHPDLDKPIFFVYKSYMPP